MFKQPSLSMRTGSPDEDSTVNEPDNYSLKWNNHSANFVQSFEEQFLRDSYVDVTLVCLGGVINAHKIVLSTCSPFFARIFAEYESDEHAMVVLKDFSKEDLNIITSFMYRGEVFINHENMASILTIAKNLEVKGLVRLINEHLARQNPGPVTVESPEPLDVASPTEAKEHHDGSVEEEVKPEKVDSTDDASPLQLTTIRDTAQASNTDHQSLQRHSFENGSMSLMPRRKQARPRRRSGEDGPQDLSSSKHAAPEVSIVDHLNLNCSQQQQQSCSPQSSPDPDRHRSSPIQLQQQQSHQTEDMEEEAENLSMNRDSGRSRSSSRSAQPTVKSETEELRSCPSTPRTTHQPHPSPNFEYPGSGLQTTTGLPLTPPMHHPNEYLNSINQLVSQWSPAHSQNNPHHHPHHHHHHHHQQQQQQQQQHTSSVHPRHPSDKNQQQHPAPPQQAQQPRAATQPFPVGGYPGASPPLVPLPAPYMDELSRQPVFFHPGVPENFIQSLYSVGPQGQAQLQLTTPQGAAQMVTPSMLSEQEPPIPSTPSRRAKKSGRRRHSEGYARRWHAEQSDLDGNGVQVRRAKGQHSAPRGGPPRCWTNYDLCNALRHVWGKKMTTSQASRTFSIPYNSLLMYVRGKYGKSLRLDELRDLIELENNNNVNLQRAQPPQQHHHSQHQQLNGKRSHARTGRLGVSSPPVVQPQQPSQLVVGAPTTATTPNSAPGFYFPPEFANYHVPMMQHLIQQHQQQQQADCEMALGLRHRPNSRSRSRSHSPRPHSNGPSGPQDHHESQQQQQQQQHRPSSRSSNSSDHSPVALSLTRPSLLMQQQHQDAGTEEVEHQQLMMRKRMCNPLE